MLPPTEKRLCTYTSTFGHGKILQTWTLTSREDEIVFSWADYKAVALTVRIAADWRRRPSTRCWLAEIKEYVDFKKGGKGTESFFMVTELPLSGFLVPFQKGLIMWPGVGEVKMQCFGPCSCQPSQQLKNLNIWTYRIHVSYGVLHWSRQMCSGGGFVVPGRGGSRREEPKILICLLPPRYIWCTLALGCVTCFCHTIHPI